MGHVTIVLVMHTAVVEGCSFGTQCRNTHNAFEKVVVIFLHGSVFENEVLCGGSYNIIAKLSDSRPPSKHMLRTGMIFAHEAWTLYNPRRLFSR